MTENIVAGAKAPPRGLHIALWVAQALLALAFLMAGGMKFTPGAIEAAGKNGMPAALVVFIGLSEVAGAIGVVLPAATRVKPGLTPLAALGLLVIMVLAFCLHVSRGEFSHAVAPAVLGALAAFVAWGRSRKAPIAPG